MRRFLIDQSPRNASDFACLLYARGVLLTGHGVVPLPWVDRLWRAGNTARRAVEWEMSPPGGADDYEVNHERYERMRERAELSAVAAWTMLVRLGAVSQDWRLEVTGPYVKIVDANQPEVWAAIYVCK